MICQTLSWVSRLEYLFSFTSSPAGDGSFGKACLAVWVECYDKQDIELTAHIWTSAMALEYKHDYTLVKAQTARF